MARQRPRPDRTSDPSGGAKRDGLLYVEALQWRFRRWTAAERAQIVQRLRWSYLGNFLDPTLWLVIYHELVTYLYRGERHARLPLIPIRSWRLFPGARFNLSPFGAEHPGSAPPPLLWKTAGLIA